MFAGIQELNLTGANMWTLESSPQRKTKCDPWRHWRNKDWTKLRKETKWILQKPSTSDHHQIIQWNYLLITEPYRTKTWWRRTLHLGSEKQTYENFSRPELFLLIVFHWKNQVWLSSHRTLLDTKIRPKKS